MNTEIDFQILQTFIKLDNIDLTLIGFNVHFDSILNKYREKVMLKIGLSFSGYVSGSSLSPHFSSDPTSG
jgi:hypothetical protein